MTEQPVTPLSAHFNCTLLQFLLFSLSESVTGLVITAKRTRIVLSQRKIEIDKVTTVKPQYNEGPSDWQNMFSLSFIISRFFITYLLLLGHRILFVILKTLL